MIRDALFSGDALPMLRRGLDVSELRRTVRADNIANAETPGYAARRVAFEEHLERSGAAMRLERTNAGHLAPAETTAAPTVLRSEDPLLPNGVNNVDIERELLLSGWNRVHMNALARFATHQYRLLRDATGPAR